MIGVDLLVGERRLVGYGGVRVICVALLKQGCAVSVIFGGWRGGAWGVVKANGFRRVGRGGAAF